MHPPPCCDKVSQAMLKFDACLEAVNDGLTGTDEAALTQTRGAIGVQLTQIASNYVERCMKHDEEVLTRRNEVLMWVGIPVIGSFTLLAIVYMNITMGKRY